MPTEIPPRIAALARETCNVACLDPVCPDQMEQGLHRHHEDLCDYCAEIAAALLAVERETREALKVTYSKAYRHGWGDAFKEAQKIVDEEDRTIRVRGGGK